jgi:hypothetical protein
MALIHPDGDFCDADRTRRRALIIGKQEADGMTKISGPLDPEARATLDAVLSAWAQLDTGQSRVNDYHHPENYLPDDEDEPTAE